MKWKMGLALLVVSGMLGGCGAVLVDEISYEYPNWTPEGLIYCQKAVTHYRKWPMGSETLGTDYYYVTMDTDGNNEINLPYKSYPYYSPKGTYAAFISGNKISIVRRSDNQEIYAFSPTTESVSMLDWGQEEDKLAYVTSDKKLFSVKINGSNNSFIIGGCLNAIWANSDQFVLEYFSSAEGIYLSTISGEGGSLIKYRYGYSPQNYSSSEILFNYSEDIRKIKLDGTNDTLLFSSYKKSGPKLSPTKDKIVGGAGYDTTGDSGIWLIDIDGTNQKQLR